MMTAADLMTSYLHRYLVASASIQTTESGVTHPKINKRCGQSIILKPICKSYVEKNDPEMSVNVHKFRPIIIHLDQS